MKTFFLMAIVIGTTLNSFGQKFKAVEDSTQAGIDTMVTVQLRDVDVFTFKNADDQMEFYKNRSRIRKVLPYVNIAIKLYGDVQDKKESDKKRAYKRYRKDLEKEMKERFEKELRNLTVSQGKVLVKLINRETGNNCYDIIKNVKGGFNAWTWQIVAKHYDYNLKESYDPKKEWLLEMAIKSLGAEYQIKKEE